MNSPACSPARASDGAVYFATEMLAACRDDLAGKTCLVSGSGNVAQHTAEKLQQLGARVVTLNEIGEKDAPHLINGGVRLVCEGANMPTTPEAIDILMDAGIPYAPGKAANAGGVAVSGLEMTQNSQRLNWTRQGIGHRLKLIMKSIHDSCRAAAERCGKPDNYLVGANVAGFLKVADAMLDQGLV